MSIFTDELDALRAQGLYRSLREISGSQGPRVCLEGREVLLLCSNNYLGLADHPQLKRASIEAVQRFGTGSGAARLVSGTMEQHLALEAQLAAFKGTEAALLFNSGYAANTGILAAIAGKGDIIYSDRLNHASIVDGAILSRARLVRYPHADVGALRKLMLQHQGAGRAIIVTDGIFSMDGDLAPLAELAAVKQEFGALLMVDDAHGTGVLGAGGRGSVEACGVQAAVDIQMGTLGKALGSFGAYATASQDIVNYLINKARSFIFSTSLPPAVLAAALAALAIVDSPAGSELRSRLRVNSDYFRAALQAAGFDTMGSVTQIVPIRVGPAELTMEFTRRLLAAGIFVQGIRPPTVPAGSCRLRCTLMADHSQADLAVAVAAITSIGRDLGVLAS
jgi:glycine C-acetyltransferase